jgi:hypothetical protein
MDPLRANAGDTLSEAIWSIAAQKERSTMRDMYRIASLLVAVTYAQMRAMGWEVLDSVEDIPANPRTFVAHRCTRPIAREESLALQTASLQLCGTLPGWRIWSKVISKQSPIKLSLIVATGLNIELAEISFQGMKHARKVALLEDD